MTIWKDQKYIALMISWNHSCYLLAHIKQIIMIHIEQFRIGNFVLVDNIPRTIRYLNNYGNKNVKLIGFETDGDYEFESARSDRLESVRITDQLLIELGFTFHPYLKLWQRPRPEKPFLSSWIMITFRWIFPIGQSYST